MFTPIVVSYYYYERSPGLSGLTGLLKLFFYSNLTILLSTQQKPRFQMLVSY